MKNKQESIELYPLKWQDHVYCSKQRRKIWSVYEMGSKEVVASKIDLRNKAMQHCSAQHQLVTVDEIQMLRNARKKGVTSPEIERIYQQCVELASIVETTESACIYFQAVISLNIAVKEYATIVRDEIIKQAELE